MLKILILHTNIEKKVFEVSGQNKYFKESLSTIVKNIGKDLKGC